MLGGRKYSQIIEGQLPVSGEIHITQLKEVLFMSQIQPKCLPPAELCFNTGEII